MMVEVYVALILFSLTLFLASYIFPPLQSNPFMPLLAALGFLILAGSSILVTKSFCEFNTTSTDINCVDHEVTASSESWMQPFWFAFFIICILEMFVRAFIFTTQGIETSYPKMGRRSE